MIPQPPNKALRFLRWFCRADFLEEIEGDLIELFELEYAETPKRANRQFTWNVLRHFRPDYIRFFHQDHQVNPFAMFKNDLKIASRNLKKQPFFTFLNTFGLAIGIAGSLLIALHLHDELTFDKMFTDADRIHRVNIDHRVNGETNSYASVSGPLASVLEQDCPQIEMVTRFRDTGSKLIRKANAEQNVKEEYVVGADSNFLKMFGLDLLVGNPETALKEPNTLILTQTAAAKHFSTNQALGQRLVLDNDEVYIVTGVIADMPTNSFLRNHSLFLSIESFEDARSLAWNNWNYPTFVKLLPTAKADGFHEFLSGVKDNYLTPWAMTFIPGLTVENSREAERTTGDFMRFNATALTDIHLYSIDKAGEFSANSSVQNIYILVFIGLFLILLASINFMNLSTAYSLKRAKEVGIRKTLGSNRWGLIRQFLSEAFVITFLSVVLGIALTSLVLPFFNELADKSIRLPFEAPVFWLGLLASTILLGLISGAYPAFFMSNFSPINALKKHNSNRGRNGTIRNGLVIFQFSISVFLIVCTLVVFQQLNFIQNKDLGYQKEQILVIEDVDAAGNQLQTFKETVQQLGQVSQVALSSFLPTPSSRNGITFFQDGKLFDTEGALVIENWKVDHEYVQTLNLEMIAGRDFNRQFPSDSSGIILNESTVKMLKVTPAEAIGMRITDDFRNVEKENMKFSTIIGVVKNFHFETLRNSIDAMSLSLGTGADKMMVKLVGGDFSSSIANIEKTWTTVAKGQPFNYYFMDDSFNKTYQSEQRLGRIFGIFALLSIFIACLGLFGLAAFNAENRIKEIGIRKVLGASVSQITYQLSINFLKLVGIAIFVALPLGWMAMNQWLADFSYRINISWSVMGIAAILAVLVSLLTLSYQSIKAAITNPIKSLRSE